MKKNEKFEKHDWDNYWNASQEDSLFHKIRQYFDNRYIELIKKFIPKKGRILEVGCGTGYCSQKIAEYSNYDIYALDYSNNLSKFWKSKKVKFFVGDGHHMKWKDDFFDVVWNAGVLEHMEDPLIMLKEMRRVCKKNGVVCIIIPYIFDMTAHLRLYGEEKIYTKKTLFELLKNAGRC